MRGGSEQIQHPNVSSLMPSELFTLSDGQFKSGSKKTKRTATEVKWKQSIDDPANKLYYTDLKMSDDDLKFVQKVTTKLLRAKRGQDGSKQPSLLSLKNCFCGGCFPLLIYIWSASEQRTVVIHHLSSSIGY
jgi:hypothetical protein